MNKKELENQINQILTANPILTEHAKKSLTKFQREILYYEKELIFNNVLLPTHINLGELEPDSEMIKIGIHGHTRKTYMLHWEGDESHKFSFALENTTARKKMKLIDCPDEILKDIYKLLPLVVKKIADKAAAILNEEIK